LRVGRRARILLAIARTRPTPTPARGQRAGSGRRPPSPPARRQRRLVGLAAGAIVLALAVLVGARLLSPSAPVPPEGPVPPDVLASVTNVPAATFAQVGRGTATALPIPVRTDVRRGPSGLPLVTYIGAEYCPFCAAERWPLIVALSRFGQFANLRTSHSASDDVFPNTPTFSFAGASFSGQYLEFSAVELQSNVRSGGSYAPLQTPTADQAQLLRQYSAPPYVPSNAAGSIPFIDIAGQYIISGATYRPEVLRGQTLESIAGSLANPASAQAQAIIGAANGITAALCAATDNTPADVCGEPAVKDLQATLAATPAPAR
jgi:Domain of unknown function (DUF929)